MTTNDKAWNEQQMAVFSDARDGEGNTMINALAGTGKTTTIVASLNCIPRGEATLMVAFNKSIAEELGRRVPRGVETSTLHSFGLKAITRACGRLPIDGDKTQGMAKDLLGDGRETFTKRRALCKTVSIAKNILADSPADLDRIVDNYGIDIVEGKEQPTDLERADFVRDAHTVLERSKSELGSIDFDDMVWLPYVMNLRPRTYDRVMVDEVQDLNASQISLLMKAINRGGRVTGVGDPRQAIYGFRGATVGAFEVVREALSAKTLPLSVTYRCARAIVAEVQKLVPEFTAAPNAEEGIVRGAEEEEMERAAAAGDFVLSRSNAPLVGLCLRFLKEGRRAAIQGRDIGASLAAMVRRSRAENVQELAGWVSRWRDREVARLTALERDCSVVFDKADTLLALTEGADSLGEVDRRLTALFAEGDDAGRIVLSTTHKAKGLERDRVWMLADTYQRWDGPEEANLAYVAKSRARRELVLVRS